MKALLVPVKEPANAKQRLAPYLSTSARAELAGAFWQDFFDVVVQSRGFDAVFVVSSHEPALHRAREFGWQTIPESEQRSESASVDYASTVCAEKGITALLRMPVDLPLVEPRDIAALFAQVPVSPGALIVPSGDGDGTNALLRTPPSLFRSHFGPGSFRKHIAAAEESGGKLTVLRNPCIEVDVDTAEDLRALDFDLIRGVRTRQWLEKYRAPEIARIKRAFAAG